MDSLTAVVPTKYWHPLEDGRVQCDLCPRYCKLHEGQRGFCFVRLPPRGLPGRATVPRRTDRAGQ
jgi:pyruvate formate lyase activating enzyme